MMAIYINSTQCKLQTGDNSVHVKSLLLCPLSLQLRILLFKLNFEDDSLRGLKIPQELPNVGY